MLQDVRRSTQGRPPGSGRRLQLVKGLAPESRWKKPWYPPLPQPLLTTAYKIRPIIVFQGLVFCPALWLKDPARRGMILPLPRVHRTGLDDFHFKLRVDGAHQPQNPKTPKPQIFKGKIRLISNYVPQLDYSIQIVSLVLLLCGSPIRFE